MSKIGYPYPCGCNNNVVSVSTSPCPTSCLDLNKIVVGGSTTAQLPCGEAGPVNTLDIPAIPEVDVSVCTDTLTWQIKDYDTNIFSSVAVDAAGVLSFKFSTSAIPNTAYEILMKVVCDGPLLSALFKVVITVGDACFDKNCDEAEPCDPCTGNCTPIDPEAELS